MENKAVPLAEETLRLYRDYDLSKNEKVVSQYINDIIKDVLQNEKEQIKISDKWFVEYSVLATTIDPYRTNGSTGQLRCYSFIKDDEKEYADRNADSTIKTTFKDKIEKYISPIIAVLKGTTEGEDNNWWFHNPETFLAPKSIDPYISFTNNQDVDPDIVKKISEKAGIRERELREGKAKDKYEQPDKKSPFYSSSMDYSRTFSDLLGYCRSLYNTKMSTDANRINDILINHYHEGVENARLYYDKFIADVGEKFCYLTFPIVASPARFIIPEIYKNTFGDDFLDNRYQGLGHCFIYFNIKEPALDKQLFEAKMLALFQQINIALHNFAFNYTFNLGLQLQARVKKEAVKSAKAAIMSRNMSHNLGSHVMFYIKQRLESVEKILQTGTLQDLVKSDSIEGIKEKIRDASTQPGEEMPFLVGLGRFINYLQERQDYIATVATDYIPYKTSISFKDAIYDELKPDLRAQRHNSDKTVKGKQPANLLLDYIAYSEGFHPSKCIKLKFGDEFDGTSQVVPNNLRKLNVALPSGNLGRQAFFSIMENVIRNTAKHDGATNGTGGILGFQFDILDSSQLDNIPFIADASDTEEEIQKERMLKRMKCYGNKQNKENYNYIGITANTEGPVRDIDGILQKIQDGIIDRYTENNGQMRDEFKGIKEMRISAAWMRGYGIDTDIPINEPPALAVRDNCGHIQYIICLPKPKKIAFVYSTHEQIKDERMPEGLKVFRTMSRYIDNSTDETEGIKRFVKDNCIADYELIVCTTEDSKRFLPYVGSRIYTCDDIEIYSLIKAIQEDDSAIADIYIKWLEQKFKCQPGGRLPKLIINDGQAYENHISDINGSRKRNVELGNDRIMFNSGDSTSNQLVYSKHYNPKEHRFYDQAPFVEGISGGNSTDRLLRQDEWTKEWYVKHMTAALTKVAIFDERIYSNFIRLSTRKWDKEDLKDWLDKHKEILKDKNPQRALLRKMDSLSKKIKTAYIEALLEKNDNGEYVFTKSDEKLTPLLPLLPRKLCTDCTIADLYRRKGVWAFNIKVEEKEYGEKCVIIVGYTKEIGEKEIARLTKGANQHDIVLDIDKEFINKFHFITIHQGILDKMYSALGIRKEEKHLITDELFDKFSKNKKEDDYLPQFIIHSGRSKPNDTDMPQKQPFIQFAALDHAVKDCKYTLTELLYSAHYE